MTTPFSSDTGRGQEGDQEAYTAAPDTATGVDSAFLVGLSDVDFGLGDDEQVFFIAVLVLADMDSGTGYDDVTAPHTDTDAGVGADTASLGALTSADAGSGSEGLGPIGIWPFPPPWLFAVGGGYLLIWRPGTPEAREVRMFDGLNESAIHYARMIRESSELSWPTDSDEGVGAEASRPTANIVQYAIGALVTCGVPA